MCGACCICMRGVCTIRESGTCGVCVLSMLGCPSHTILCALSSSQTFSPMISGPWPSLFSPRITVTPVFLFRRTGLWVWATWESPRTAPGSKRDPQSLTSFPGGPTPLNAGLSHPPTPLHWVRVQCPSPLALGWEVALPSLGPYILSVKQG